ncbi:MAG: hypothetical protein HN742_17325 [Lentisphaerae bacterium]|jgi:hypothetical protein|nr:hypothetical protein [Lentisphaerota bacterium]MBT4823248.1 hypothetical protein [Lentisphaerota bacterium]MBT5605663.1 hypothetical protein [Lentisphaerota bacterium]MBT7056318.1 hypothetical protein [Lentisphaerota bacterium]MBT7843643.1 hypothetical protein [Lentisphaerota bacterium]
MDLTEFTSTLDLPGPPEGLTSWLRALWLERNDDWDGAHCIVQRLNDALSCNIHAYLHRKEPDESNARYWYGRVGISFPDGKSFEAEWQELVNGALAEA